MIFFLEFNSIKTIRHSAVEICWTDNMMKELVAGTLTLHLCAAFPPWSGCCPKESCQSTCRAGACLGQGGGWGRAELAAEQSHFTDLQGPWESHRGTQDMWFSQMCWWARPAYPSAVWGTHAPLQALEQASLLSVHCVFSLLYFLLSFLAFSFFFVIEWSPFFSFFLKKG